MKKHSKTQPLNVMHAMESLGIVPAASGDIRAEKLQERFIPTVPFPHRHDFFQLVFIVSGSGTHEIDFKKHVVSGGEFFIMKPAQVHSWSFKKSTQGFVIEFTADSFSKNSRALLEKVLLLPDMIKFKTTDERNKIRNWCTEMHQEFILQKTNHDEALKSYLDLLLIEMFRRAITKNSELKNTTSLSENFRTLLESHFKSQHSVGFYAKEMKLTPKALTMRIHRALGKSARQIIQERLILEARRLLAHSPLAIAEIGTQLGFEDANYFSRFFRTQTNQTPIQFRERSVLKK